MIFPLRRYWGDIALYFGIIVPCLTSAKVLNGDLIDNEKFFRQSHFTLPLYKATLINNEVKFMDGPIELDNAVEGMYFIITSDNYEDYAIRLQTNTTSSDKMILELKCNLPSRREFDVIILEALNEDLVPVSRTAVLLFNPGLQFDLFKMTFRVDDQEYIILNFYYFKWFLGILTVTGFLILFIELHEIMRNLRIARQNLKYQELENI
ncbi:uncharacterized protein LOC126739658 [Anthonomus grandis grandis]|uniref:uncharacterized protein LOC126739658 n=1 Tax=Anthonomus grandis grandis TaxID=2921223 RepID=UPI002165ADD7|nr:uncharacterized protein LOC126739658 [Anthonomus grandis grandis]